MPPGAARGACTPAVGPEAQAAAIAQAQLEGYTSDTFESWAEDVAYLRRLTPDVRVALAVVAHTPGFTEADAESLVRQWPGGCGQAHAHFGLLRDTAASRGITPVEHLAEYRADLDDALPLDVLLELVSLVHWGTPNPPPWGRVVCAVWRNRWLNENYPAE